MHKGKHRFENNVPAQERFHREGEEIDTTAKPVCDPIESTEDGEEFRVPDINRNRRIGQYMYHSTTRGPREDA